MLTLPGPLPTATSTCGGKTLPDSPPEIDAGTRYAFAPYLYAEEIGLYRIYITFKTSDGGVFLTGTEIMATSLEVANNLCDALNSRLKLTPAQCKRLSADVFRAVQPDPFRD